MVGGSNSIPLPSLIQNQHTINHTSERMVNPLWLKVITADHVKPTVTQGIIPLTQVTATEIPSTSTMEMLVRPTAMLLIIHSPGATAYEAAMSPPSITGMVMKQEDVYTTGTTVLTTETVDPVVQAEKTNNSCGWQIPLPPCFS